MAFDPNVIQPNSGSTANYAGRLLITDSELDEMTEFLFSSIKEDVAKGRKYFGPTLVIQPMPGYDFKISSKEELEKAMRPVIIEMNGSHWNSNEGRSMCLMAAAQELFNQNKLPVAVAMVSEAYTRRVTPQEMQRMSDAMKKGDPRTLEDYPDSRRCITVTSCSVDTRVSASVLFVEANEQGSLDVCGEEHIKVADTLTPGTQAHAVFANIFFGHFYRIYHSNKGN